MTVECPYCIGHPGKSAGEHGACMRCRGTCFVTWEPPRKVVPLACGRREFPEPTAEEREELRREEQARREYWERYERYA